MFRLARAVLVAAALSTALSTGARGAELARGGWEAEAGIPAGLIAGHTTYRISASEGASSVASELEFPLAGPVGGLRGRLLSPVDEDGSRWEITGTVLLSLGAGTGTLKDSDWLDGPVETNEVGVAHPGKDVYSTSSADLSALIVEARVGRRFPLEPTLVFAPFAGYLYQRFALDARDVRQVGYGPYAPIATANIDGKVIDYGVTYGALFAGARGELASGALSAALDAWFTPFAWASDRDDHLLRAKLSETDASGFAWQVQLEGRYASGAHAFGLQGSAVGFRTEGEQRQRFYAGPNAGLSGTIDARITSLRWTALASWSYRP